MQRAVATIDLKALQYNFTKLASEVGNSVGIMPMVKANAYGHGLLTIAHALSEAKSFGVATLSEAIQLRSSGIKQSIFVMCGFLCADEIEVFSKFNLTAVVHHKDQVDWLENSPLNNLISVWLLIDTGMHRLGVMPEEVSFIYRKLNMLSQVIKPIGVMTHFASADNDFQFTQKQYELFMELVARYKAPFSLANSAAILNLNLSHCQLVRPGGLLYGISSFEGKTGEDLGFKPVMRLTSSLVSHKYIRAGEVVGYGGTWRATKKTRIGVVNIGYGDGYPRNVNHDAGVILHGKFCNIVGRVSMDFLTIDITDLDHVAIGDEVVLWGDCLSVEKVAAASNTIGYDLACNLNHRISYCVLKN